MPQACGESGEGVLFSRLLREPPPDELLAELFPAQSGPFSFRANSLVTREGLAVLRCQTDGLTDAQTAQALAMSAGQVRYRAARTLQGVMLHRRADVVIDVPYLQKKLGLPVTVSGRYTRLSELLRDMPADDVLRELHIRRGNLICSAGKGMVRAEELRFLQAAASGRSYAALGQEIGITGSAVRSRLLSLRRRLVRLLHVELDVPGLFPGSRARQTGEGAERSTSERRSSAR